MAVDSALVTVGFAVAAVAQQHVFHVNHHPTARCGLLPFDVRGKRVERMPNSGSEADTPGTLL